MARQLKYWERTVRCPYCGNRKRYLFTCSRDDVAEQLKRAKKSDPCTCRKGR